jgi:hypothetical protein
MTKTHWGNCVSSLGFITVALKPQTSLGRKSFKNFASSAQLCRKQQVFRRAELLQAHCFRTALLGNYEAITIACIARLMFECVAKLLVNKSLNSIGPAGFEPATS